MIGTSSVLGNVRALAPEIASRGEEIGSVMLGEPPPHLGIL